MGSNYSTQRERGKDHQWTRGFKESVKYRKLMKDIEGSGSLYYTGAQASLRSHPGPVPFNPEAVHDFYKKREGCREGLSELERLFN